MLSRTGPRIAVILALALMASLGGAQEPAGKALHEVYVDAPTALSPMSASGARVIVFESTGINAFRPVDGAAVAITLVDKGGKTTPLFEGKTGAEGSLEAMFPVPAIDEGDYTMQVKTTSKSGEHTAQQPVKVKKEFKILLVTDKPLYQPGQVIHMRALALHELSMKAAGGEVVFEVEDGKGNKVFKKKETLSAHGVAAADFTLADEVNMGDYRITALVGQSKAEKAVTIKKYVLPKFKPVVKTDKPWYLPKETVKGTLQADYFFGKPVAGGDVKIKASTFDVELKLFAEVKTKTDAKGACEFEVKLPDTFVGTPLEKGNAYVQLEVELTDTADHTEKVTKTFSVANTAITLGAIPESGKLVPGIENIIYVATVSPAGTALECEVALKLGKAEAKGRTNDSGFCALRVTPNADDLGPSADRRGWAVNAVLTAKDKQGNEASKSIPLSSEAGRDQMLVRIDKGIYRAGETVKLDLFGTFDSGRVFIDAVKGGQTMLTTAVTLEKGRAEVKVPLPASLFGSIEFHAYKILGDGEIVRDTRVVYVHPPQDLQIAISADKDSYKPAEAAKIGFTVTNRDGKGVAAALGVVIVDESVYALQDMQPGLEKVYFTLAKELQEPKYGIKVSGSVGGLVQQKDLEARQQETAVILLAPVTPAVRTWQANTMQVRAAQLDAKLQQIFYAMQNHIVSQKKDFWQVNPTTKKREFKASLLAEAGLKGDALTDPWGKTITLDGLQAVSKAFAFDYWAKTMSAQNYAQIFQALRAWVVAHEVLEGDGFRKGALEEMVKAGAVQEAMLKDYFGEMVSLDRLAAVDGAFKPSNVEKLAASMRKQAVFDALVKHVNAEGGVRFDEAARAWVFDAGLIDKLKVHTAKPKGGAYTLDELAKEVPAFAADNIARIAGFARRASLYAAIHAKIKKDGWGKVASFDGGWKFAAGLLDQMVKDGLLTETQSKDVGGRVYDLSAIAKEDAQFVPDAILSSMLSGAVQAIDGGICSHIHGKNQQLPEDPVEALVKAGALKEAQVQDPWGTRLKVVDCKQGEASPMGCGLLNGRKTCLSAGPDRQFGTEDDLRLGRSGGGTYQPNYAGCVFFQQDGSVAIFSLYDEEDMEEQLGALQRQNSAPASKGFSGGKPRGGGRPQDSLRKLAEKKKSADGKFDDSDHNETGDDEGGMPAGIRVREYFPETLLWKPLLITDENGRASLDVTMADSITTWRVTASANTADGLLGSTTKGILVFQPFFVDIDFPVALTQNDAVSVPVAVYNYLKDTQTITLKVEKEDWFELRDDEVKKVELKAGEVKAVYFRVKVTGLGTRKFTVFAWGKDEAARDAIRRSVEVVPDGKMVEMVINDRLSPKIEKTVEIPANAIAGSFKIFCKCYPGVFSQVVEGVEGMLGMPHG